MCLKDRIDTLEQQLAQERQRCRVAEKRAEMLNGDEGPSPISLSFDAAYKEREKELLRFEVSVFGFWTDSGMLYHVVGNLNYFQLLQTIDWQIKGNLRNILKRVTYKALKS